jgi:alkylation response protein AidB-like acyl-CoA dehydrogenase
MGGYGYSEEYPAERFYRDATMQTIPDGTTQIQQMVVARDLLGLAAFV